MALTMFVDHAVSALATDVWPLMDNSDNYTVFVGRIHRNADKSVSFDMNGVEIRATVSNTKSLYAMMSQVSPCSDHIGGNSGHCPDPSRPLRAPKSPLALARLGGSVRTSPTSQVAIVEQQRFQVFVDGVLHPERMFNTSMWGAGQVGVQAWP